MTDGVRRVLSLLLDGQAVPCSGVSRRAEAQLRPLLDAGAIRRSRRGRGLVFEVGDMEAIVAVRSQWFPHGDGELAPEEGGSAPPRSQAVARHRDAKRARRSTAEPVLLRAVAPFSASREGELVDLYALTVQTGAACLLIDDQPTWSFTGPVAIVENLEVFLYFERLATRAPVALYAGGRLSERVLSWLASGDMAAARFVHCGDYDPVGMDEYLRLRHRLSDRVTLYVPDSIERLFTRYAKRSLVQDSTAILDRLRGSSLPEVRRIVALMDESGCGLEQEALFLTAP